MSWTPEKIERITQIVRMEPELRDILLSLLIASRGQHEQSLTLDEMRYRAVEILGLPSHRPVARMEWKQAAEMADMIEKAKETR